MEALERIKLALGQEYVNGQPIDGATKFDELGLDSLEFLDLAVSLGVENNKLGEVQTVADLAALL